ncbi:hypothetical protein [Pararhizobium polonicum]|uniref:hypothetical protein n=1 Tax=Pararhizobium polonicum TaxID=1612624 RepID=UPI00083BA033|nr:hypothetical protein [Pararhizobium polonicum]
MDADGLGKWAALAAAVIATGQAGTTWVDGYYKEQTAKQEAIQNLELAAIKERSDLSKVYLDILLAADTDVQDRALVYDALSELKGHPLQPWAKKRAEVAATYIAQVEKNLAERQKAMSIREDTEREIVSLKLEAESLRSELNVAFANNDDAKIVELRGLILTVYQTLSQKEAAKSVADIQVAAVLEKSSTDPQGAPVETASAENLDGQAVIVLSQKVTAKFLYPYFAENAKPRLDEDFVYLQNALKEFKVSDPRLVAIILATLAIETPSFNAYEEPAAAGERYEGSDGLGNTQPGDGVKFRGRGYVGITGRQNYTAMASRLGFPSLLDVPEDAKKPEVAARIALAWIMDRQKSYIASIESNDFVRAGRLVRGGRLKPQEQERYESIYHSVFAKLTDAS